MWLSLRQGRLQLNGDSPLAFRQARGYWVECVEGRLWLTVTGQPGDFLLDAGQRVRIASNGLALVAGLPAGTLRLYREPAWPLRSVSRLLQGLRGWRRRALASEPAGAQRFANSAGV